MHNHVVLGSSISGKMIEMTAVSASVNNYGKQIYFTTVLQAFNSTCKMCHQISEKDKVDF